MSTYDFSAQAINGATVALNDFAGKITLIVNVASQCGLTPQYTGLEALYKKYKDKGLAILGFPCDQFAHQEPGSDSEIEQFCSLNYGVSFPLFSKIEVNGPQAHPLFAYLRAQQPGENPDADAIAANPLYKILAENFPDLLGNDSVKWNFTKFLIGRDGTVLKRFEPTVSPEEIEKEIAPLLN